MGISAALNEALIVQRKISEQLLTQTEMQEKLSIILSAFKNAIKADCVALYAVIDENYLEKNECVAFKRGKSMSSLMARTVFSSHFSTEIHT